MTAQAKHRRAICDTDSPSGTIRRNQSQAGALRRNHLGFGQPFASQAQPHRLRTDDASHQRRGASISGNSLTIRRHAMQSGTIRHHAMQSVTIRHHAMQSGTISGRHNLTCEIVETRPKSASCAAVCGTVSLNHEWSSVVISGHHWPSVAITCGTVSLNRRRA